MKNILIGIAAGIAIGILLFLGYQDYNLTKMRVGQIEKFLNNAIQQEQINQQRLSTVANKMTPTK